MSLCPKRVLKLGTKMRKMKFTQANVNAYKAPAGETDHIVHDEGLPGFSLRVRPGVARSTSSGTGSGPNRGNSRFGTADKVSLKKSAKRKARGIFEHCRARFTRPRKGPRLSATVRQHNFVASPVPHIHDDKGRAASYVGWNEFCLETHWKPLHRFSLNDVDRSMVAAHLACYSTSGETSSDRCRSVLSKFYNWAIGEGLADNNPGAGHQQGSGR